MSRTIVLLTCALPAGASQTLPGKAALAPLQGRWYSVSTESDGKEQSGANRADVHIITADEVVALLDGTIVSKATIKRLEPDPENGVGRITLEMNTGSNRGKTWVLARNLPNTASMQGIGRRFVYILRSGRDPSRHWIRFASPYSRLDGRLSVSTGQRPTRSVAPQWDRSASRVLVHHVTHARRST